MIFLTHKKEIIQQNIKKLKPLKYNKFYWWRRYTNVESPISKHSSIKDKIKAGYYDFPASFWDAQLCLFEINESYVDNIRDYEIFLERNSIPKTRYKKLIEDYYKEEEIKLGRIIKDFTDYYILKKYEVIKILENFDGDINELYNHFEKNYSYAYGKPSYKKSF